MLISSVRTRFGLVKYLQRLFVGLVLEIFEMLAHAVFCLYKMLAACMFDPNDVRTKTDSDSETNRADLVVHQRVVCRMFLQYLP